MVSKQHSNSHSIIVSAVASNLRFTIHPNQPTYDLSISTWVVAMSLVYIMIIKLFALLTLIIV